MTVKKLISVLRDYPANAAVMFYNVSTDVINHNTVKHINTVMLEKYSADPMYDSNLTESRDCVFLIATGDKQEF